MNKPSPNYSLLGTSASPTSEWTIFIPKKKFSLSGSQNLRDSSNISDFEEEFNNNNEGFSEKNNDPKIKENIPISQPNLWHEVFLRLDAKNIKTCREVSKSWNVFGTQNSLWKEVVFRDYGIEAMELFDIYGEDIKDVVPGEWFKCYRNIIESIYLMNLKKISLFSEEEFLNNENIENKNNNNQNNVKYTNNNQKSKKISETLKQSIIWCQKYAEVGTLTKQQIIKKKISSLQSQKYFHGVIGLDVAEKRLSLDNNCNSFLICFSEDSPGDFNLATWKKSEIQTHILKSDFLEKEEWTLLFFPEDSKYPESIKFSSLEKVIEYKPLDIHRPCPGSSNYINSLLGSILYSFNFKKKN